MIKLYCSFLAAIFCLGVAWGYPQQRDAEPIEVLQDSLAKLGYIIYNEPSEPERIQANMLFIKTLVSALQTPHSYDFPFDSLRMVSILRSPDDSFRIFTWHLPLSDGSYLYYGAIQLNTSDGQLQMIALLDRTYQIATAETAITEAKNWYGAQYYRIVPFNGDYLLLGWKGDTPYITQKVIEVLRFEQNGVRFGRAIFNSDETPNYTRLIYRYSRQASMYMDFDPAGDRIVVDHLVPAEANQEGHYDQYGPDLSFDAWKLTDDGLTLISDVELMNPPDQNDIFYNDPTKPSSHPKSGFSQ